MTENQDGKRAEDHDGGPVEAAVRAKLTAAFRPTGLSIVNQSHLHAGHAGAPAHDDPDKAESHFKIEVVSGAFGGLGRVQRQRLVNEALAEELAGPVHMLSMTLSTPGEA